ncbi:coiled-coil alpha-helical rod protein 1-like isoform X2 [Dysidea avara]|uniref:coiled-coil alpha-helical rod protein 1-like isoform X2 n=1 Tax=Dysidea avara TaxID=196820 RepID=UPI0033277A0E
MLQATQMTTVRPPSYFRKADSNITAEIDTKLQEMEKVLQEERGQHAIALQQLTTQADSEKDHLKAVITQLQNEVKRQASCHEQQLLAEITKMETEQASLNQSYMKQSKEAQERISYLEQTLEDQRKQDAIKCEQLEQRIRVLTEEVEQARNMLQRLQDGLVYDDVQQLKQLKVDNEQLQSNNDLLQVRLSSLLAMFSIQETAAAAKEGGNGLLSRWRQQVFTMMVQRKLLQKEQQEMHLTNQRQIAELQDKVKALKEDNKLMGHSLSDKNAQIKLHSNQINELEKKQSQLVSRNKQLVYQLTCQQHYLTETATSLHNYPAVIKQLVEVLEQLQSRLGCYEQRLSLAAGRVATAQATLIHRRALQSSRNDYSMISSCQKQLEAVSRDRDRLVEQLQQGAILFERQLQSEQHKFSDQKKTLESQVAHLQVLNASLQQEGEGLTGQVQRLQQQLIENQRRMEKAMETAVLEEKHHNNKKCAELEEVVNRLQLDLDKIELRLQQQQRLANREKEHAVQQIQLERDQLEQQLQQCHQQLCSLQAERSLLIIYTIMKSWFQ